MMHLPQPASAICECQVDEDCLGMTQCPKFLRRVCSACLCYCLWEKALPTDTAKSIYIGGKILEEEPQLQTRA